MRMMAIIQARMGSTRLPGKVLMPLAGRPMVARVVERVSRIPGISGVILATTDLAEDDAIVACARDYCGVPVVRGSAHDVLDRYLGAIASHPCDAILRVTADCPLLCPVVGGRVVDAYLRGDCDYASNTLERTWPRGLDCEAVSVEALRAIGRESTDPQDREHVTIGVWRNPERFRLRSVRDEVDHHLMRWTVDTPEDFELVRRVYDELGDTHFDYDEVLAVLNHHPEWSTLNAHIEQKRT